MNLAPVTDLRPMSLPQIFWNTALLYRKHAGVLMAVVQVVYIPAAAIVNVLGLGLAEDEVEVLVGDAALALAELLE